MAISTLDGYIAAAKQQINYCKTAQRTTVANTWFSLFELAGNPGAGTLAGSSTAAGVVPTGTASAPTAGVPGINAFGGTAVGYLATVDFGSTVAARMLVADCLFKAGAYAFTAGTTTLSAQPSYASRVPGGTDYAGTQIWVEVSTAFVTGTAWQVQITYTNQAGTAGRTSIISAAQAAAALTLGKCFQIALQAGDTGVQKIESVIATNGGTAMTAGNYNVLVLRPLWTGRARVANDGDIHGLDKTGLPVVFDSQASAGASALMVLFNADSTSSGVPELQLEIASG